MKLSKYNLYREINDKVLIYNFLSGEFGITDKEKIIERNYDTEEFRKYGFSCQNEEEEDLLAMYKHNKMLHTSELNLTILASENCNFACQYCFDSFNGINIKQSVADDIILYIRKNIRKFTAVNIGWFGGEPLLAAKEIERMSHKILEICHKSSRSMHAQITTNGYLLDVETFKKLLKCNIYSYEITLDGFESDHNKNRSLKNANGSYNIILNNLRAIRDEVKSRVFQIVIRVNLTKTTLDKFVEFCDFLKKEFGWDRRFVFRFGIVYNWGGERIDNIHEDLLDSNKLIYELLLKNKLFLSPETLIAGFRTLICSYAVDNTYTIRPDGGVIICPQINSNNIGGLKDGNIIIDQNKLAKWYGLDSRNIEGCQDCLNFYLCKGKVCPANLKAIEDNGLNVKKIPCRLEKKDLELQLEYIYYSKNDIFRKI